MLYHLDDDTDSMGVPALGHAIDQLAQAAMAMIPPPGAAPLTPINTNSNGPKDGQPLMPRSRPGMKNDKKVLPFTIWSGYDHMIDPAHSN